MTDWNEDMTTAPLDGAPIEGRNKDGESAIIISVQTHPKVPSLRHWSVGGYVRENENWSRSKIFYPVEWRHIEQESRGE